MDERLSEQDLYDFNIAFDERLGMYKLSAVLCYDLDTNMLYCYDSKGNGIKSKTCGLGLIFLALVV